MLQLTHYQEICCFVKFINPDDRRYLYLRGIIVMIRVCACQNYLVKHREKYLLRRTLLAIG